MKKIALVTGGSRGLGKSMVLNLVKKGYKVVFTYKNSEQKAKELVSEDILALKLDVSKCDSLDSFVKELKTLLAKTWKRDKIDLLVNNAGIGINTSIEQTTPEQFDELFNIHVKSPFFLTQKLLATLKDGSSIVNISTGLTRFSLPGFGAYAMMKGAVEVMTRYLALELGKRDITVNTIAPGAIETDFGGGVVRDVAEVNQFISAQIALGRAGRPDDIGAALAQLISQECHWLNAQRVELSGGMRI
ncbi:MAG: SDR family oxidoreductase [Sphaerochaetaceae bacterium]|nr:SDR family oxidoreductase [Sphaerochaetaceae bacterium]